MQALEAVNSEDVRGLVLEIERVGKMTPLKKPSIVKALPLITVVAVLA